MSDSEIRQIPKIAGAIFVKNEVMSPVPHDIPDQAMSLSEISSLMYNFSTGKDIVERSAPTFDDADIERKHWDEIVSSEEKKISEAEKSYNAELERIYRMIDSNKA